MQSQAPIVKHEPGEGPIEREQEERMDQETDREALLLGLALEDALLDKLESGARLALHPPKAPVANVRVIEAAHDSPIVMR